MQPSPQTACDSPRGSPGEIERSFDSDDLIYQAVTVVAILLVLASLWVF